jgi:glutamate carboxypeptidase
LPGMPVETARREMVALGRRADAALSFEATIGNSVTIGRRGSSRWQLEVEARSGHSSQIFSPELGSGAVFEAARILAQFHASMSAEKNLTFNPSLFVGGTEASIDAEHGTATGKPNVIAAKASVSGDLRFLSQAQEDSARERMRKIVAANLPRTSANITFESRYPAMTPTPGNYELLELLNGIAGELGHAKLEALDPGLRGAGDVAFVAGRIPVLDGIGGHGDGAHAKGEYIELDSLPDVTKRAALLIYRLTR